MSAKNGTAPTWAQFLIDNTPAPRQPDEFTASDYVALMAKQGVTLSTTTAGRKLLTLERQGKLTSREAGVFRYYKKVDQA